MNPYNQETALRTGGRSIFQLSEIDGVLSGVGGPLTHADDVHQCILLQIGGRSPGIFIVPCRCHEGSLPLVPLTHDEVIVNAEVIGTLDLSDFFLKHITSVKHI